MPHSQISQPVRQTIVDLYRTSTRTVDDLPYTDEFDKLYEQFGALSGTTMSRHDLWRALAGCRKRSLLTRKGRASKN